MKYMFIAKTTKLLLSCIRRFALLFVLILILCPFGNNARACTDCGCIPPQMSTTKDLITTEHSATQQHIEDEFFSQEDFMVWFFMEYLLPAMMLLTEQLSAVALQQMEIVGTFMDAKQQMETQRLFQKLETQVHKDYYPSVGVCTIGTTIRSLSTSERYTKYNAFVLSQRSQDRQLGHVNTASSEGGDLDRKNRMNQFMQYYCDVHDNHNGLGLLCAGPPLVGPPAAPDRLNKDINYARTIDAPLTLNLDFCNWDPVLGDCVPSLTNEEDEADIMALASNLYAHELFLRVPEDLFELRPPNPDADLATKANQARYLDLRAIVAKRSVAENSFNVITAMKAKGSTDIDDPDLDIHSEDTFEYMKIFLDELGLNDPAELLEIYGERPSYYAQMDILTKKVFQRPEFYTSLYDKPANVIRKGVALQAIDLMQDLDTFKSYLRTEAMLSVLLELEIMIVQKSVDNRINRLGTIGDRP